MVLMKSGSLDLVAFPIVVMGIMVVSCMVSWIDIAWDQMKHGIFICVQIISIYGYSLVPNLTQYNVLLVKK